MSAFLLDGNVVDFDIDTQWGQLRAGDRDHRFHASTFVTSPRRPPSIGESVRVVMSIEGALVIVRGGAIPPVVHFELTGSEKGK